MNKQTLQDVTLTGKRVFVRVDFNVPMKDGAITDETRIKAALPTIKHLVDQGAKVILASHLGRPKGEVVEELRLKPVADRLSELLGKPVALSTEARGEVAEASLLISLRMVTFYCLKTCVSMLVKRKMMLSLQKNLRPWQISM